MLWIMFFYIQEHPSLWSDSSSPHPVDALSILLVLFILSPKLMMDSFALGWVCGWSTGTTKGHGVSRNIGRLFPGREMARLVPSLLRESDPAQLGDVAWGTIPPVTPQPPPLWAFAVTRQKSWQKSIGKNPHPGKTMWLLYAVATNMTRFPRAGRMSGTGTMTTTWSHTLCCLDIWTEHPWLEMRPLQWKKDNMPLNYVLLLLLCGGFGFFQFSYL